MKGGAPFHGLLKEASTLADSLSANSCLLQTGPFLSYLLLVLQRTDLELQPFGGNISALPIFLVYDLRGTGVTEAA